MEAEKNIFATKPDITGVRKEIGYPPYTLLEELSFEPIKSDQLKYYKQFTFSSISTKSKKIRRNESWKDAEVLKQVNIFEL